LFIGSYMDILYSNACKKRIQEEGIGEKKIGGFCCGMSENPPWPPFLKGGITLSSFDTVDTV
jgi:hypothetical protein